MQEELQFIQGAGEALRQTEKVLMFYGAMFERRPEVNLAAYLRGVEKLAVERGVSRDGLADLQAGHEFLAGLPNRRPGEEEFARARRRVEAYLDWLKRAFAEACRPACAHPDKQLQIPCERCRAADATVHVTIGSITGIERHDFCRSCHSEIEREQRCGR